ncbi:MAG TPA: D-aminoacyl-tRNA deacylase [Nitrospinota bacterium]|jgi:D-tyrosyl-tRNA(Tyr) deacylase|nr:D-aminoacyl-tRNA deacylase [Nitrospinota bacterium]MDP7580438.1 D-aminoacyl-tRNA deacylase [Nitrospinota bacterium]HJN01632.1 D-aminoacyl-tRNA deacylase [Nitrospinota bacterium]|tara:strand:- start:750 stop:1190 length:441 start_codon:yes stop_codon:yes gene_type:complete
MKIVLQRVSEASVEIDEVVVGKIGRGIIILLCVEKGDSIKDVEYLSEKTIYLRVFDDEQGKMNLSLLDINAEMLIISQFSLAGDCRKGRRPGFDKAAEPDLAKKLYLQFIRSVQNKGVKTAEGKFGALMSVNITNDGPVTFILESK